jgi:hypothetical protein
VVEEVGGQSAIQKDQSFERRFGFSVIHKHREREREREREIQLRILKF